MTKNPKLDPLHLKPARVQLFSAGQAASILEIEPWQLQKLMDVRKYQLRPPEQMGKGRGSRRLFSFEDLYRLAIAVDQSHFWDGQGNPVTYGVALRRGPQHRLVELFPSRQLPKPSIEGPVYYVLDFADLMRRVKLRAAVANEADDGVI